MIRIDKNDKPTIRHVTHSDKIFANNDKLDLAFNYVKPKDKSFVLDLV